MFTEQNIWKQVFENLEMQLQGTRKIQLKMKVNGNE